MQNDGDLLALASRVEAASGADRALDYDIAHFATRAHMETGKAPAYTASVDDALSLLPKTAVNIDLFSYGSGKWGCSFMDTAQLMGKRAAKEQIARLRKGAAFGRTFRGPPRVELEKAIAEHFVEFFCRDAATAALALCAAALRARATHPQKGE
jgi:hypothetical protein